jgi:hypothetical protein
MFSPSRVCLVNMSKSLDFSLKPRVEISLILFSVSGPQNGSVRMVDLSRLAVQRPTTNDGRRGAVITTYGHMQQSDAVPCLR